MLLMTRKEFERKVDWIEGHILQLEKQWDIGQRYELSKRLVKFWDVTIAKGTEAKVLFIGMN